jgi:hypothetical protein
MYKGLLPIKRKDHRTFDFHRTFGTATGIPEEFNFDKSGVMPDQNRDGNYNACTAYANNDIATSDDKAPNFDDYRFIYQKTLLLSGLDGEVPVEHMKALKAATVYGVKRKGETEQGALAHRRGQYFLVKRAPDFFDGVISAMWIKQGGLSVGSPWPSRIQMTSSDGVVPNFLTPPTFITGHCWAAVGVKKINGELRVICKSWQGSNFGDKGYCYFNREQINKLLSVTGAGAFVQKKADPREIQYVEMTITETILSYISMWLDKLLKRSVSTPATIVAPEPSQAQPGPIEPEVPKYDWDNPVLARHSVRVICDEEGLTTGQKNTLCATIACESGFNPKAINFNRVNGKVVSTDYGICQWNDYYHGKEISPDEAVNNPEKAVRLMCKYWKKGLQKQWVCYSSGRFAKHL